MLLGASLTFVSVGGLRFGISLEHPPRSSSNRFKTGGWSKDFVLEGE